ncbi:hypothetical protein [Nostoc sp. CCY0012]|uniref:hypothetical protein n=1 Tax=Nostoc sp. CCY0012 TaxID=1056123 RepID=UPI0039C644BF
MYKFIRQALISVAVVSITTLANQPSRAEVFTGQSGNVRAEISYEQSEEYQYKNVRLQIMRAGKKILDRTLPQDSEYDRPIGGLLTDNSNLPVLDLDGNKEPEVIADFFTGGAHCCLYSLIYKYGSKSQQYGQIQHKWGNGGYHLKDVDQDGIPEFVSQDDRFAYSFASYAASGYPLQIWQYRQGKMIDVTRRYPQLIYNAAFQQWQTYLEAKKQGDDGKGFLASYLANKYMIGQEKDGWQRVQQVYKQSDRTQFFADLRKFLRETGYIK